MFLIDKFGQRQFSVKRFYSYQAAINFIRKYGTYGALDNKEMAHYFRVSFDYITPVIGKKSYDDWTGIMTDLIGIVKIQRTKQFSKMLDNDDVLGGHLDYYKFPEGLDNWTTANWKSTVQVAVYQSNDSCINIKTLGSLWELTTIPNVLRLVTVMINEIGFDNAKSIAEKLSPLTEEQF